MSAVFVRLLFSVPTLLPHSSAVPCPAAGAKPLSAQSRRTPSTSNGLATTVTMRACSTLASVVSAAILNTALNGDMTFASAAIVSVRSCDEFPGTELNIHGTVTFLRDIECKEQTIMHVDEDLFLRSHTVLETRNLHFIVHEGVTMTLHAPAMMITRDEGSTMPLFDVHGTLTFEAAGYLPGLMEDSFEDKEGLVRISDGGTVETAQEIRYYADSVAVSKIAEPGQELEVTERQPVELSPALKLALAKFHAKLEGAPDEVYSTPPSAIPPISPAPSSSCPSSHNSGDNDGESEASYLTSYFDTPGGPGARDSAPFRHVPADTATNNAEDDTVRHTASNAAHDGIDAERPSPGASPIATPISTPTPTSSPIPSPSPSPSPGSSPTSRTPRTPDTPTPAPSRNPGFKPSPYPGSSSKPTRNSHSHSHGHGHNNSPTPTPTTNPGSPGSHQSESDHDQSGSRRNGDSAPGPKLALRVGWMLNRPALSGSGNSILWPAEDGSMVFRKVMEEVFRRVSGSEGSARTVSKVLVASAAGRVKRVVLARMALRKEERDGSVGAGGKGAWGWLPWQRQHRQDVERARGRLGEVEMTLDDRACVEVSVDGITVLSRSGSCKWEWVNRFPWRWSKNKNYELYVTEDGFEVKLGERRVWGLNI